MPSTLKLGPYSPLTIGRQEPLTRPLQPPNRREAGLGSNSAVNWRVGGPICLAGTIGLLSLFICLVAVRGTGVGNDYKGIKLTTQARYER